MITQILSFLLLFLVSFLLMRVLRKNEEYKYDRWYTVVELVSALVISILGSLAVETIKTKEEPKDKIIEEDIEDSREIVQKYLALDRGIKVFKIEIKNEETESTEMEETESGTVEYSETESIEKESDEFASKEQVPIVSPLQAIDVEAEVKEIKKMYYGFQDTKDSYTVHKSSDGAKKYVLNDICEMIELPKGYGGVQYARMYYFDSNNELYFAFIFDKKNENRLYFSNKVLIRYIDENKLVCDFADEVLECIWSEFALNESSNLINSKDW